MDELIIHVMLNADTIESPNGTPCFGCYVTDTNEIYIAGDMADKDVIETIAHEYIHYTQKRDKKPFSEVEAIAFSNWVTNGVPKWKANLLVKIAQLKAKFQRLLSTIEEIVMSKKAFVLNPKKIEQFKKKKHNTWKDSIHRFNTIK